MGTIRSDHLFGSAVASRPAELRAISVDTGQPSLCGTCQAHGTPIVCTDVSNSSSMSQALAQQAAEIERLKADAGHLRAELDHEMAEVAHLRLENGKLTREATQWGEEKARSERTVELLEADVRFLREDKLQ